MKLDFLDLNLRKNIYENQKLPVCHRKKIQLFQFSENQKS